MVVAECSAAFWLADVFSLGNSTELLSAVRVNRLGWGCLRADLWTQFAHRLSEVIYGVPEGKKRVGLWLPALLQKFDLFCVNSSFVRALLSTHLTSFTPFSPEWPCPPRCFCWQGWIYLPTVSPVCQYCSSLSSWEGRRGWCLAHTYKQEHMCAC